MLPRLVSAAARAVVPHGRDAQSRRRSLVRLLAASLALASLAITAPALSQPLTPTPVKTTDRPIWEFSAAAGGTWFGWARANFSTGSFNYFVQRGTEPRLRVNAKGTSADGGGIYRRTLVYSQSRGQTSDLYRFDLRTGRRTAFPERVNTPGAGESSPTLSGRHLLFHRFRNRLRAELWIDQVLLYDRKTRTLRVLGRTESSPDDSCFEYLHTGQVNGVYAVWERGFDCGPPTVGDVVLYNINSNTKTTIPGPRGDISQESPAVSSDGTVYFVREDPSPASDGTQQILKKPLGSPAEVLHTVPANQNAFDLYVDDRANARHVYFTLHVGSNTDVYKLIDPLPSP